MVFENFFMKVEEKICEKKFLSSFCIWRWDGQCIKMLIENVATALRMDEAKLDSIEDPSFHLTSAFKESKSETYSCENQSNFFKTEPNFKRESYV